MVSDVLSDTVKAVTTVAHAVGSVVSGAFDAIKLITTGSLSGSGSQLLYDLSLAASGEANSSSYGTSGAYFHRPGIEIGDALVTAQATLDVTLEYHIVIASYSISNITAIAVASFDAGVHATFQQQGSNAFSKEVLLGTVTFDTITIDVGIPVVISPSLPVHAGVSVGLSDSINAYAFATFAATLTTGVMYAGGVYTPVHAFQYTPNYGYNYSESVGAVFHAWLQPTLVIDADYFGGPFASVKATAELVLNEFSSGTSSSASGTSASASSTAPSSGLAINVNLLIVGTIGAKIGIDGGGSNFVHTFGPATVLNYHVPLYQNTIALSSLPVVSGPSKIATPWMRQNMVSSCPDPTVFPLTSYIGQALYGILSPLSGNNYNILGGSVTMKCIWVTEDARPYPEPPAFNVHFACTLSAAYVDSRNTVQFYSQQVYCDLRDSVSDPGTIVFSMSSNQTVAFSNTTSTDAAPGFDFSFSGVPGSGCATQFILTSPGLGSITITGANSL